MGVNDLRVQVHAASVNPIDNMIQTGLFKAVLKFQLPVTLGSDLAGVVTEVGTRVTRFKPGDAVFANIFDLGTGAIAEFAAALSGVTRWRNPSASSSREAGWSPWSGRWMQHSLAHEG